MSKWNKIGWTIGGFIVGSSLIMSTSLAVYSRRYSILFPGEPKSFEVLYDKEFGIPMSTILPTLGESVATPLLLRPFLDKIGLSSFADKKTENGYKKLIKKYPNSFIGYAGLAEFNRDKNPEIAKEYYEKSIKIANENPEWTKPLELLLLDDDFFNDDKRKELLNYPSTFENVTDNIWTVMAPYCIPNSQYPLMIQSTIIRLSDNSLVIINPTKFTNEIQEKINNLGIVKTLITPTGPHGAALAQAYKEIWPNAKLYGTDPYTKHDQPNLPWNGFFTTKGLVDSKNILIKEDDNNDNYDFNIQNEFEFYCLSGHVFKEVLFYHKPSKSLLGITDMMIYVQDFELMKDAPWPIKAYFLSLGLNRPDLDTKVVTQSYHIMFTIDQTLLQSAANEISKLDIEHITFGHGGIIHGKEECKNALYNGFYWIHNAPLTGIDSIICKILWRKAYKLPF